MKLALSDEERELREEVRAFLAQRFFGGAGGFVDDLDAGARHQALSYFGELSRSKISSSLAASDS